MVTDTTGAATIQDLVLVFRCLVEGDLPVPEQACRLYMINLCSSASA